MIDNPTQLPQVGRKTRCLCNSSAVQSRYVHTFSTLHAWLCAVARQISSPNEPMHRLLVGGIAGVLSRTLIAPLERLRTMVGKSTELSSAQPSTNLHVASDTHAPSICRYR
jgi:hypothetical protein